MIRGKIGKKREEGKKQKEGRRKRQRNVQTYRGLKKRKAGVVGGGKLVNSE